MARPQQRRSVNRGLVQPVNQVWLPSLNWQLEIFTPGTVHMGVHWDDLDTAAYGIPQLLHDASGTVPVSCTKSADGFDLVYSTAVNWPSTFTLPSFDPAIRTSAGAFLASGLVFVGTPPGPVIALPQRNILSATYAGDTAQFTVDGPLAPDLVWMPLNWINDTQGVASIVGSYAPPILTVQFATPFNVSDNLIYGDIGLASYLLSAPTLAAASLFVPP